MDFYDLNQQRLSEDSARAHRRLGYWVIAVQVLTLNYLLVTFVGFRDYSLLIAAVILTALYFFKARKYR